MATIPVVPSFITGETPSIVKLNQLASCVTFIHALPAFAQLSGSGQNINNNAATALTWSAPSVDRDTGWAAGNPTRYTVNTQGYYQLDGLFSLASGTGNLLAWFRQTGGANNPSPGSTTVFGAAATGQSAATSQFTAATLSPYLYLLDFVEVFVQQTSGGTLATGSCTWQVSLASLGP